jgi:fructose-1-phosphate kinase PfkB-like protein
MQGLREKLEQLRADAEDCAIISESAPDEVKRETFAQLAKQLRRMAIDIELVIAKKIENGEIA